jgi:dimethylpropiothetin dethiomethylase
MVKKTCNNNWYRLMAGLYLTYESVYAAGSQDIAEHLEKVGDHIRTIIHDPRIQPRTPREKPVVRHLKTTLQMGAFFNESPLYHSIGMMAPCLTWEYGYDELPEDLADKYAYTEIVGPRGPILYNNLILGMMLLGPGCHYPRHRHPNIEGSYIGLGGYVNINDQTILATNSLTLIPAGQSHHLSTDGETPALLTYAWLGDQKALTGYRMRLD